MLNNAVGRSRFDQPSDGRLERCAVSECQDTNKLEALSTRFVLINYAGGSHVYFSFQQPAMMHSRSQLNRSPGKASVLVWLMADTLLWFNRDAQGVKISA